MIFGDLVVLKLVKKVRLERFRNYSKNKNKYVIIIVVHRCGTNGNMRPCHAADSLSGQVFG